MKHFCYLIISAFSICGCASKNSASDEVVQKEEKASADFNGDYEYYAGPEGDGYLYYKISIKQLGDSVGGSIFSGIYLSKNDQGYYSMPAATITNELSGKPDAESAIVYLGKVLDSTRMDNTYSFPEAYKIFGEDGAGDPVQSFYLINDGLQIVSGQDTLVFTKVKSK